MVGCWLVRNCVIVWLCWLWWCWVWDLWWWVGVLCLLCVCCLVSFVFVLYGECVGIVWSGCVWRLVLLWCWVWLLYVVIMLCVCCWSLLVGNCWIVGLWLWFLIFSWRSGWICFWLVVIVIVVIGWIVLGVGRSVWRLFCLFIWWWLVGEEIVWW